MATSGAAARPRSGPVYRLLGIVLLLGAWELTVGRAEPSLRLASVVASIVGYLPSGEVRTSVVASLRRIVVGFALGASLGLATGVAIGLSRTLRSILDPVWGFLRPMSPLAWVPLSIVWFGVTEQAAIFVIAYASFFPVMLNTATGMQEVNVVYREAALTLGADRLAVIRHVMLPAAVPFILAGLRISLGLSWAVIVAAELVIGAVLNAGLGYLMLRYTMILFDMGRVLSVVVLIGVLAYALDQLMRFTTRKLTPWRA
jgi:ABC-type nitrate/sulfonate/bicarbonate transport system permease component